MAITQSNPYLTLNGTAQKAVDLYVSALSATVESIQYFDAVPGMTITPELKGRVIHASLRLGGGLLMLSDAMPEPMVPYGEQVNIMLNFDDVAEMEKAFNAMAEGGVVTQPLDDTFWGARYGALTDRFGVPWMFNCPLHKA